MAHLEDDECEIPLRDQRYFGAGIKRKRVQFVPSTSTQAQVQSLPTPTSTSAASRYLDIVLKGSKSSSASVEATPAPRSEDDNQARSPPQREAEGATSHETSSDGVVGTPCEVCKRPIRNEDEAVAHHSSITHQICLQHSHPPSHIDRRRKGLQVLSGQGWDPDSRLGLGAAGEGILHPIKATENPEKAGLGLRKEDLVRKAVKEKPVKLDAGKVRAMESERKKKGEKLRDAFYRSEDVEKYLGDGNVQNDGLDMKAFKSARKSGLK